MKPSAQRRSNIVIAALFLGMLLLPGIVWLIEPATSYSVQERKKLVERPSLPRSLGALAMFPSQYETYVAEHVGLRDPLLALEARLHLLLDDSPTPKVVVGRDGWLFLGESLNHHRNVGPVPEHRLQNWLATQLANNRWLATRGIPYFIVVAPDKHTIYGEFMPDRVRALDGPSGFDGAVAALASHDNLKFIDLRRDLINAKTKARLYHKTDSHWNARGADIAQHRIAIELSRDFPTLRPVLYADSFDTIAASGRGGANAQMLYSSDRIRELDVPVLRDTNYLCPTKPNASPSFSVRGDCVTMSKRCERRPVENPFELGDRRNLQYGDAFEMNCDDSPVDATLVVFRDSFFTQLVPFLSAYFTRTIYIWSQPIPEYRDFFVRAYAPDAVLYERVEREAFPSPRVPGMMGYLSKQPSSNRGASR